MSGNGKLNLTREERRLVAAELPECFWERGDLSQRTLRKCVRAVGRPVNEEKMREFLVEALNADSIYVGMPFERVSRTRLALT